jgi:phage portal protein BeeE
MVPMRFTVKATHTMVMAMSMGHSSSAYSLLEVRPSGRVIAALTMMACQPQKLSQLKKSENMRALSRRWSE